MSNMQPKDLYEVDQAVIAALPFPNSRLTHASLHGHSLWGTTSKLVLGLPNGTQEHLFLKVIATPNLSKLMAESEHESLKAIYATCPGFCPKPYTWGKFHAEGSETYFLLSEFREIGAQPAGPEELARGLADLHKKSISPTGKFGFHVTTTHAAHPQAVNVWTDSWCELYTRHLSSVMDVAKPILAWPDFDVLCKLTLSKVVPRLLLPLQSNGRSIKPCLLHGDCWDGNTALDARTGNVFVFDPCSFYGHNEYDIGDWRAPRHLLSDPEYRAAYQRIFPPSEPVEEWEARNRLYSLTFNICNALYIPGSTQRQVVYEDMRALCEEFFPEELEAGMAELAGS